MIVVKIGGALITDKRATLPTLRPSVLGRLGLELSDAPGPLALVHGAGSFGHPVAKRHGFSRTPREAPAGAADEVRASVRVLHGHVLAALHGAGLPARSLEPSRLVAVRAGAVASVEPAAARDLLAADAMPVTFGDLVPDLDGGYVVVSGDVLAFALADALDAKRVVFATDVDGLLSAPPGSPGARLVPTLDGATAAGPARAADVTGGLASKVELIRRNARGRTVGIVNGLVPGRLQEALRGRPVGTWTRA